MSICIIALFVMSVCNWYSYWQSRLWVQTSARIETVEIIDYDDQPIALLEGQRWDGRGFLRVTYQYTWSGQSYTGHRVSTEIFKDSAKRIERYHDLVNTRSASSIKNVWLDPKHPDQSAIYREISVGMILYPCFAFALCAALTLSYRHRRLGARKTAESSPGHPASR